MASTTSKFFDESIKQFNDLQAKTLEPTKKISRTLVDSYEQYAQLNYEVLGDLVDYSIAQSKLAAEPGDVSAFFEAQQEAAKSLADNLTERAGEYAALATSLQDKVKKDATPAAQKTTKASPKKAA